MPWPIFFSWFNYTSSKWLIFQIEINKKQYFWKIPYHSWFGTNDDKTSVIERKQNHKLWINNTAFIRCFTCMLNFAISWIQCIHNEINSIKDIQLNVTVENISLPSSDTMKVLGTDIDDRLTFDGHISNMCIKAGRQLNVLQRLRGSLDQDSRMAIYKSFIMSNFNYCPLIWMFTSKTSLS